MIDRDPATRLEDLLDSELASPGLDLGDDDPVAAGWATVELDRAVAELSAALRIPAAAFLTATASTSLGARCLVARGVLRAGVSLALLEPNTEGRLAGTLARHGEGPVALWLAVWNLAEVPASPGRAGRAMPQRQARPLEAERPGSQPQAGPFGPERLLPDGPIHGPHRLLVVRPGTIRA